MGYCQMLPHEPLLPDCPLSSDFPTGPRYAATDAASMPLLITFTTTITGET
ncbi:MAG: hypothetical protein IJF06_00860 [Bacteroidaceae bacterium]|nr:hypothetical protein [Bacteroidaceae bacterium]